MIKQKRKEKAGKWKVPVEKVKPMSEDEMFKVLRSGKRKNKAWKRLVNKVTFVSKDFVRKPPKFERFIRPTGLRFKKAHVTHPELKATFCLPIIGVKKNPSSPMYTNLGVITKVRLNFPKHGDLYRALLLLSNRNKSIISIKHLFKFLP